MATTSVVYIKHGSTSVVIKTLPELADKLRNLASKFQTPDSDILLSEIELYAQFLEHCVANDDTLALVVFDAFIQKFCVNGWSIHVAVQEYGLSNESAQAVLRAYYSLWKMDEAQSKYREAAANTPPALLGSSSVRLMAMFGGQRGVGNGLEEASWLLDVYRPLLEDYVLLMSEFLQLEAQDVRVSSMYFKGFNVFEWLMFPEMAPDLQYLRAMPVCLPITGLTQLMQIMVLYKTLFMTPGELAGCFKVAVGHSLGIALATVFSMLSDEASYDILSTKILGLQMLVGALPQQEFPYYRLAQTSEESGASPKIPTPYPMVSVRGICRAELEQHISTFNAQSSSPMEQVYLAVVNTSSHFIVSGVTISAAQFVAYLTSQSAHADEDQSRIPFKKRRSIIDVSYLEIVVPYHCCLLESLVEPMYVAAQEKEWVFASSDMRLPVHACADGHDIRDETDVTHYLLESMCLFLVDWPRVLANPDITHIVDFGPGGFSGFGLLAHRNVQGRGVPVICAGALASQASRSQLGTSADLYKTQITNVITEPNWLAEFGPRLVRMAHDDTIHIDSRMHRVLGMPTVMVAGMTPTTCNSQLVSAISRAGYHAEFAGGGIHSESDLVASLKELTCLIEPGYGITLNCIYVDQRQWGYQLSTLLQLRAEGLPIAGLCIGGGVPSFEKALELVGKLRAAGLQHVSFKPSNAEVIRQVVMIAKASDGFPIVLQWTGGRGGGHHSFEDFHQPILQTYAAIRACDNITLIAGSGFGDTEGTLPYITGDWSIAYGRAPMPFDGILLGSRIMAAKEAKTSPGAKELIVAAAGLSDSEWQQTYDGAYNGVTTLLSEYGELNHVLATRAAMLYRELSTSILSKPREMQLELILARKDEIISRLNSDYMRPWFGKKTDGRVVDLEDMTYTEVISRMVELMYITHMQRWVHASYLKCVLEFIARAEARLNQTTRCIPTICGLTDADPLSFTQLITEAYPEASTRLVSSEDVQFFVSMCKRRGQKPPPFIPAFDADFGIFLAKDTIWQSEQLDAIVDQDPQRVVIQQGPVAAQYTRTVDEPVKDILNGIYHGHIDLLLQSIYGGDISKVPVVEYIGADPSSTSTGLPASVQVLETDLERTYTLPSCSNQFPDLDVWLQTLHGPTKSWLSALLTTSVFVRGCNYGENSVRRLLRPRCGRKTTVYMADGVPSVVKINDVDGSTELKIERQEGGTIELTIYKPMPSSPATLCQRFQYVPSRPAAPITQLIAHEAERVRQLYADTWVDNADNPRAFEDVDDPDATIHSSGFTITEDNIRAFCRNISNQSMQYWSRPEGKLWAPMEFAFFSAYPNILRLLCSTVLGDGQLSVVHLTNRIELAEDVQSLTAGDCITSALRIEELVNTAAGKKLVLSGTMSTGSKQIASARAVFLSRKHFIEASSQFKRICDQQIVIKLTSTAEAAALEAKEWFVYREDTFETLRPDVLITFCLDSIYRYKSNSVFSSVITTGKVTVVSDDGTIVSIADVDYAWDESHGNPVLEYLRAFELDSETFWFEDGGYQLSPNSVDDTAMIVPNTNIEYARISSDMNPIHVNPYIADIIGLPAPITHGQWTSSSTRAVIERCVAGNHPERIRSYDTEYTSMVLPRDKLSVAIFHAGMRRGRMLISGYTSKAGDERVMNFSAEIEQPHTAYVFTGQGSQHIGMGMQLYEQSAAARAIWDHADKYMIRNFGIPLLHIVRINPTEHVVYFEDEVGEEIRNKYVALSLANTEETKLSTSTTVTSESFNHRLVASSGLLNATQITQPALTAYALAAVADMRSQSLVQQNCVFAGHSLGEICALAAIGNVFSLEDVMDIAFCRGLIMQSAITRDEQGYSEFGMAAVNPSRVGKCFDEAMLLLVIGQICVANPGLLQIANYNVRESQYVVAGTLVNLAVLRMVLDAIATGGLPSDDTARTCIDQTVSDVLTRPVDPTAVRGIATIPLEGIDVPFHSTVLSACVPVFRKVLRARIKPACVSTAVLEQHYIPNLTGMLFEVSREYIERVASITNSAVLVELLGGWDSATLENSAEKSRVAVILLIELLAYQLASPVEWIRTQDYIFGSADVQRMVEIGPSPILCGMASRTLKYSAVHGKHMSLLHVERDRDAIYYRQPRKDPKDVAITTSEMPSTLPNKDSQSQEILAPQEQPEVCVDIDAQASTGRPIDDVALQAIDIVHAIVAFKMKQPLSSISTQQSIKTLVGGKSILQNEIIGDLQKEFGNRVPDKPEQISLQELSTVIGLSGVVLGKCTQPLVARLFSSKMPGGFSLTNGRTILQSMYGLGPQRQDALLLVALTMEPSSRLTGEAEAGKWLDTVAQAYAAQAGIKYAPAIGGAATAGGEAQGPVVSSAEMKKMQHAQREHIQQQIEVLARYAGINLRDGARAAESNQANAEQLQRKLDSLDAELGNDYAEGIMPHFDALKDRRFDSSWNWARQEAYEWIQETIVACGSGVVSAGIDNEKRIHQLQSRADEKLVLLLSGAVEILSADTSAALEPAKRLAERLYKACKQSLGSQPGFRELSRPMQPQTLIPPSGTVDYSEVVRTDELTFGDYVEHMKSGSFDGAPPLIHLREQTDSGQWAYSEPLSAAYYAGLGDLCGAGVTFAGKTALVTGCGRGSIGAEIARGLLMGGARVLATTSSYSRTATLYYEDMYRRYGARGSELVVVPFNQGSVQDIEGLTSFVFGKSGGSNNAVAGLGWDLDYVFPFAAVSDIGSVITNLGSHSELAQRVILTNVLRLLGSIKTAKEQLGYPGRPSLVVLPLSPNHGTFGGDGLYGECKLALETAFNRWRSETWKGHLSIAGAVIGWTRGTGLMSANNLVAQEIEKHGVRTFSTREMAFNILGLLHPLITRFAHRQPVWADLSGGLNHLRDMSKIVTNERLRIEDRCKVLQSVYQSGASDMLIRYKHAAASILTSKEVPRAARHKHCFPTARDYDSLQHLRHLEGMVNLDKVVVITGYGEVGPYGNAETRWEIEAFGELSMEGCIELAWIMGLIRHVNGPLAATSRHYTGWVDSKSGEAVRDVDIKTQYEQHILEHTGIRLIEPELVMGYDPTKKQALREVQIEHDMEPFEASAEDAAAYKKSNGDRVDVWENVGGSSWSVRFLKGALIRVPAAVSATRLVAGLLPTGWDASRFGIPEDVIKQVDPVTLYTLVATVEALVRSGITDPYELYQHIHVSEIGNTIGSGIGGASALDSVFHHRRLDKEIENDSVQETFVSTIQAWLNMLLISGAGPVNPAVGACATAVLSIDSAVEAIQSGKARVMLAGGVDDFFEVSTTEFGSMGATANTIEENARGRTASEMSRPCTSTRSGFVEGEGAGVVVLMSATAAIECGAPIYGVVAMSATATDKQGRSIPAPGQGVLTSARELGSPASSRMLDFSYRSRKLQQQLDVLDLWRQTELDELKTDDGTTDAEHLAGEIEHLYLRQKMALQDTWFNEFWKRSSHISPLRGSLAAWGLTADDIGLASFHGTSTLANDKNESNVLNAQLRHLGRTPGHVIPVVCQKWLTGHSKGAAASFMLNGVLKSFQTGLIPGNRNADNISQELRDYDYPLYLSNTVQTTGIKAALLKTFGFGQVGGELLVLHPDYVLATLDSEQLDAYNNKVQQRSFKAERYLQDVLVGRHPFVQVKNKPPFTIEQEQEVYLNPLARARYDPIRREYTF
ncbi:fatty acid synthase [Coemansia reversa NRRL 1564]|uniref:Fatty acid synthase n=1 Tax=Coemansia reversa (strain ATCC 12441 / NRRL 1564) TaxID=763665 RepID=A0A2G5B5R4_COERN|nr:fatty acid synthase [Coemansia reversa NRRL 1564]|eukprot:PIA14341.1 fatty acid synthase [Coemansia reversa NRRL 1564]